MSNLYCSARTNYFAVEDLDGLKASLKPFPEITITASEKKAMESKFALCVENSDYGGWPGWATHENGEEVEFDFVTHVMPFVKADEVVVVMETGAEKLRYLVGYAEAYIRQGETVMETRVSIDDIYTMAAEKFKTPVDDISRAEY